jgi:uncharacterized membrane protein
VIFKIIKKIWRTRKRDLLSIRKTFAKTLANVRNLSKHEKIVVLAILAYIVVLSTITSLKYYCFKTLTFDFGVFVQIFYNSLNGNLMFAQPRAGPLHPTSFLGVHVSPLIILLLPFYALIQSPYTLLVIQTIALALPAIFVYRTGVKINGKEGLALLLALGYLVYPGTLWPNWYDFHLESFVPLFSSMAYYNYFSGNKFRLILSLILLLTTFERAVFIALFFVIYIFIRELYLRWKKGEASKIFNKGMVIALLIVVGISLIYFFVSENIMNSVWPQRGIVRPTEFFKNITYDDVLLKISYIVMLTAPLAFLPLDSPLELLPAAPYLFLVLATDYNPYFTITWQYPALISIPFFASAFFGASHHNWKVTRLKLVAAVMLFAIALSPGSPLMSQFSTNWTLPFPDSETLLKHQALSILEANATVLAQENIFPNIADRKIAYSYWPNDSPPPDYIVIDVFDSVFYREPNEQTTKDALLTFIKTYDYGVAEIVNGFMILKKDYQGPRNVLVPMHLSLQLNSLRKPFVSFEDQFIETHFFAPDWVKVQGDHLFLSKGFGGNAWWGPWVTVPPGKYRVEVQYSIDKPVEGQFLALTAYWWNHATYAERTFSGDEARTGQLNTVSIEFELKEWVPALEIVGTAFGKTDIRIYSVTMQETP